MLCVYNVYCNVKTSEVFLYSHNGRTGHSIGSIMRCKESKYRLFGGFKDILCIFLGLRKDMQSQYGKLLIVNGAKIQFVLLSTEVLFCLLS